MPHGEESSRSRIGYSSTEARYKLSITKRVTDTDSVSSLAGSSPAKNSTMSTRHTPTLRYKVALTIGFLATAVGVAAAYTNPATGYELSIYRATPTLFWVGIGVGLLTSLYTALGATDSRRLVDGSLLLATVSGLSVVAIPVYRSYFFYGAGDSMTHLGWAKEIQSGAIEPFDLLYPAIHLMATFFAGLSGLDLTNALQHIPLIVFPLVFVVSLPLCIRYISDTRWATIVGVFTAIMLIPINTISAHLIAHPSSQAILFLPFVVYLLFRYLTGSREGFPFATPLGVTFALAGIGLVFLHPQETMTFLFLLLSILVLQLLVRQYKPNHVIANHRPIYPHSVLVGGVFLAWTAQHERAVNTIQYTVESLLTYGPQAGSQMTTERTASLITLGGSIEEIILKLFGVSLLFSLLAAGLILTNLFGKLDPAEHRRNAFVTYLTAGLAATSLVFFVTLFANLGDHFMRFQGVIMVLVSLLGAIALTELFDAADHQFEFRSQFSRSSVVAVLGVVFVVFLAMQLAAVHHSPYLYQPNQQVTESDMSGYEIAFDYHDGETELMGLRAGPRRFVDAHYGSDTALTELDFPGYRTGVPGQIFNTNVTTHYGEDRYLVIRQTNVDREVTLYDELRYSEDGFRQLETDNRVNRVQHNGDFKLYRITGT